MTRWGTISPNPRFLIRPIALPRFPPSSRLEWDPHARAAGGRPPRQPRPPGVRAGAFQGGVGAALQDEADQAVAQAGDAGARPLLVAHGQLQRFRQPDRARHIFRVRTVTALLAAAVQDRPEARRTPREK